MAFKARVLQDLEIKLALTCHDCGTRQTDELIEQARRENPEREAHLCVACGSAEFIRLYLHQYDSHFLPTHTSRALSFRFLCHFLCEFFSFPFVSTFPPHIDIRLPTLSGYTLP